MAKPSHMITFTPSTTAMQLKTATNQARNTLLRERRTGDNSWTCCDLTCDSAPQMYRHIAAHHEVEVQEQANKQLSKMRSRPASKDEQGDPEFRSRRAEKYESDPISLSCSCDPSLGTVILFYAYLPIADPVALAKLHKSWSSKLGLYGKVKLATEGINATLSGHPESIVEYIDHLTELPDFAVLNLSGTAQDQTEADRTLLEKRRHNFFKPTGGCRHVFAETISIKVVEEICPLGAPELSVYQDPENKRGKLPPSEFHQKLKDLSGRDDVVVLDVRNYYESDIGRFPGAITPPIRKFSSFRDYVDRNRDQFSGKTLLSYCTGGIRCEKATTYLRQSLQNGDGSRPTEVLMLDGGIHNYLEWIKQENLSSASLWLGKNYVFDARQSLGLEDTTENNKVETGDQLISVCRGCGMACARYVKCDGFGCHRLIIACQACSPVDSEGRSGICCCDECHQMGEQVRTFLESEGTTAPGAPRIKRGICLCERQRREELFQK